MRTTSGSIGTATGSDNAFVHPLDPVGNIAGKKADTQALVVTKGTHTGVTVAIDGLVRGTEDTWISLSILNRKTKVRSNGSEVVADNTTNAHQVDVGGCSKLRVYPSAGTPTAMTAVVSSGDDDDFGGSGAVVQVQTGAATLLGEAVTFGDDVTLGLGDADDITATWNGTKLVVDAETADSAIDIGVDGAGIDLNFMLDTASSKIMIDQSADSMIFSGVAKLKLQTIAAATGTAIPVTHSGSFPITQNGAESNSLAIPTYLGQTLSIFVDTDTSGARTITSAQRINQAGNTTILLTEVGDFIKLEAITIGGALRWQVIQNDGCVLGP